REDAELGQQARTEDGSIRAGIDQEVVFREGPVCPGNSSTNARTKDQIIASEPLTNNSHRYVAPDRLARGGPRHHYLLDGPWRPKPRPPRPCRRLRLPGRQWRRTCLALGATSRPSGLATSRCCACPVRPGPCTAQP